MEKKDLEEIAEVIREKDIFVISDEIYSELVYDEKHSGKMSTYTLKQDRLIFI